MGTTSTARQAATETEQTPDLVVVVRAPYETLVPCHTADAGSLLRPAPMEHKRVLPGVYPVTYETCACGEREATVKLDAKLLSRKEGPWYRRRTLRTFPQALTTVNVSGPADEVHEGLVIDMGADGTPGAYFAEMTENGPTPYEDLF
ncbi:hypothetical protein ACIGB8_28700 [Promicromonospora sukumoe]|uniref:hypothetical protein n=1 Tax=Promicromonospora sukumoe TaxID=88382 RepID=UPI0037CA312A